MCVIIHQPQGTHLEKDRAERLWKKNPDGGGFVFVDDENRIQGWKAMEFQTFWSRFEQARSDFPNRDFILHMRIATHGEVNLDNVHPFQVTEDLFMAHNGIIHGVPDDPENKLSDTRMFIRDVLPELPTDWLDRPYLVNMVEEWIGWSKLAFLSTDPNLKQQVYILNEDSGTVRDGMWFSNSSGVDPFTPPPATVYRPTGTVSTWPPHKGKSPATRYSEGVVSRNLALWDAWQDDWMPENDKTTVFEDRLVLLDLLKEVRKESGLEKRVQWDAEGKEYICWGCDETVDEDTGECDCWNKVCLDCESIAGLCKCPSGWSSNLSYWTDVDESLKGGL